VHESTKPELTGHTYSRNLNQYGTLIHSLLKRMKTVPQLISLAVWLVVSFAAAGVGSLFTPGEWYAHLQKPAWTPPGYLFGPVWTVLYALMGTAAWLIWIRFGLAGARIALTLFILQLILNAMWSWIFFGLHNPGMAFFEILLLWVAILATVIAFWHKRIDAGALLLPYLAWVSFAAVLNYAIWRLNGGN
jgi:translocator protein